jgi:hypothetical protein
VLISIDDGADTSIEELPFADIRRAMLVLTDELVAAVMNKGN